MRIRSGRFYVCTVILWMAAAVPSLDAQSSYVRAGSFEFGGFAGVSYGLDDYRAMGGGNVTFAVNKYILPYAEVSYFPGILRTVKGTIPVSGGTPISYTQNSSYPFTDFHGGVHIRMPIFRESPVVPYLVFGVGGLRHSTRMINVQYQTLGQTLTAQITDPAGTDKAINGGGGIRYYIGQRFGLRVEAKVYKPYGEFTDTFAKIEAGFFYQAR
ncbi:MAG TPA: hypothetical protein VMH81_29270 [Bryobacteraceae bacterium]|nr:hypothetical protein [Bryobacteraceae bacterium]